MKISSWAATALATPAIATGICLLGAATAQAAPDDTASGNSTSSGDASSTSPSSGDASSPPRSDESRTTTKRTGSDGPKHPRRETNEADTGEDADDAADEPTTDVGGDVESDDESGAEGGAEADVSEVEEADDEVSRDVGPASVPSSTRAHRADSLVTLDVAEDSDTDTDTVGLALNQISDAREDLKEATWDSGNVLAGLAAMLPQLWLGGAYTSLERWQLNHAALQEQYAATVDKPFAHWIATQRIETSIRRTVYVQDQLDDAQKWLGVVGAFGPREQMAAINELIDQAADNGLVYQILNVTLEEYNGVRRVSPIFAMSINGGEPVNVLLDTGSLGLVINPQVIGLENLGAPIGSGTGCYGDCSTPYRYDIYNIPIAVDKDVVSTPTPVNVVTLDTWFGLSQGNGNYEGILGIGPNAYGPGASTPLGALPGLLSQGILMDYRRNRAILGPNPYAARVTLAGAPRNNLMVKIGDNDAQVIETLLDTGGLTGVIPSSLVGGAASVPDGTLISVYSEDGETLLFSFRTKGKNTLEVNDDYDFALMGFQPFSAMPIYTSFVTGEMALNYA